MHPCNPVLSHGQPMCQTCGRHLHRSGTYGHRYWRHSRRFV